MRAEDTRAGGRYLAEERGYREEARDAEQPTNHHVEIRAATAPLAEFLPENDKRAMMAFRCGLRRMEAAA